MKRKIIQNWGFIKYCQIELQNPFANLIYKYRFNKANKKWSKDRFAIYETYKNATLNDENYWFKWSQLIEQEIFMWIRLGKQVELNDFNDLCKRRGFHYEQKEYLRNIMKYVGLGKNL